MSSPRRFPLAVTPLALAFALALALVLAPSASRAEENLLRGPFPFIKDNEVAAHVMLAAGLGDAPSGTKLAFEYGYKFGAPGFPTPGWLDLQINLQRGMCRSSPGSPACGNDTGDAFETLGGVGWRWPTSIPVVPFANVTGGFVFVFPNGATSATGLAGRVSGGANYYFFDWLGAGAAVGFSFGHVFYDSTFHGNSAYTIVDVGGGVQVLF